MSEQEKSGFGSESEDEEDRARRFDANGRDSMPGALSPEARARRYGAMAMRGETTANQEAPKKPSVSVEVYKAENDEWVYVGEVSADGNPGSFSNNYEQGRDLYLFGVDEQNNVGYVKKTVFGIDKATNGERTIQSSGYEDVATLRPGESYEMDIKTDISDATRKIRLTFADPTAQDSQS